MKYFLIIFLILSSVQISAQKKELIDQHLNSGFYSTQFTGFYLYDPITKEELYNYNGNKFFIPASNTKIFTLYTAMKMLNDSIPAFKYQLINDELHVQGTGDPTFLHPKYKNTRAVDFLKNNGSKLIFHWNNFDEESFLPGWTWDDFRKNYSPERSQFPIHENLVSISKNGNSIKTFPTYFEELTEIREMPEPRSFYDNKFYISNKKRSAKVPFIVNETVIEKSLSQILGKPVDMVKSPMAREAKVFYSQKSDDVYREMMENSDNFLAEHLLILASSTLPGKLSAAEIIAYAKQNLLKELKQQPEWFDGSGLSRYNLFTPQSFSQVLEKMYNEFPEERLFSIFPIGGKTGTIKNRYRDTMQPYIYAKTGTLSNNVTLSGYLKTKSGRTLIFSLMNNNSVKNLSWIRNENEKLLRIVRDHY
ncbi:D-alanyl-D-alanine carboxypeptidase [Empedobacter stercoris]|uniref:D-alanyl-D-alanine carboxypeptidase n=1 Tax=Empedobacter stercoris TaxID=1628248 RepID=A0ABX1WL59_9FLAO|nr:D-alanyl-D-alanine carboxypeptidase [Empedobacter stercoris]MCA4808376.1 D-alanyl-D-alanine carboxypeptidase [Empedobacter stercoris]NOJ75286.1 D-alanyl-D-alanine carboxypeptidase [Empedobacter stercoris]QNT15487.1 D-alanyl-D-alanine carboxypeptidase [Empedobacter stercoris]UWX65890.1 D-alanyl-D-alanine carboxypeptidase [Empedobacter stercoris]